MSDRLRLDIDELDELWKCLLFTHNAFESLERVDKGLAAAVGHHGLGHEVERLGSSWDDKRAEYVKSLDALWQDVQSISSTFKHADTDLAKPLKS